MRATRQDDVLAVSLALALHVLLALVLIYGLRWSSQHQAMAAAGSSISAELVDAADLSPAMRRTLDARPEPTPPQPLPEPVPEDAPAPQQRQAQDFLPVPDDRNQDAVVDAPTPTPATERTPQEAKRRQEQVDLTETQRQQDAQNTRRPSPQELERQRQLEEIRRQRERVARERQLAEQRLQQLADARGSAAEQAARADAEATAGAGGSDDSLTAKYAEALRQAIVAKWTRPETVPLGATCRLQIRQIPGGRVLEVRVVEPCAYDEQGRRSVEAAVLKAQPLPYAGFESVFQRNLTLNFRAEEP
ncbi:MAG TPA: TonB C-terminal domain-containing protein [Lysobacter sp.]|nr:TonB C-terminal domain-containing protein [Lysobacter sp.]